MTFESIIAPMGTIRFPKFAGVRVLLMPYKLEDPENSLPDLMAQWRPAVRALSAFATVDSGTAYITVDEAVVPTGETHRRPGIHVDGVGPVNTMGAIWGGAVWGPGPTCDSREKRAGGMLVAASHAGCRAWQQEFAGYPGADGDCEHLAPQCRPESEIVMQPSAVYWCNHLGVHEALPMKELAARQFVRISMPSSLPWYEGCTPNPLGIMPDGPIEPRREKYLAYRS